ALSEIDQLIANLGRLVEKKRAIKHGMMHGLLTGSFRLPGFTQPWVECSIGDIAQVDPETLAASTPPNTEIDYISLEDVSSGILLGSTPLRFRDAPSRARRDRKSV